MKQLRVFVLVCLAMALCCSFAFAKDTIKIGAVFSVTGPASFLGEPERNSLEMAVEQVNKAGGLLGKQVELVIYDDETDVNKCVLAMDKLIKKDNVVAIIGPTTSGNTLASAPKFKRAGIPLVSCASAEKIVKPVNKWVFKVAPSDRYAITRILEDAAALGYKKIAIITVSNGFGQSGRVVLQEVLGQKGFEMVADEVYGPKDTDMTAQLTKIKSLNPDAIICWGTNPGPAVVARNRQQLGITTPLYMSHGVASKKFIELAGAASEGLRLPAGRLIIADQIADGHPQKAFLQKYIADYTHEYKSAVSTFGGHGWDAPHVLFKAIEMAGSTDPAAIRDSLEKVTGFVGTAGIFNFSAEDHNGLDQTAFEMIEIKNGDWAIVK